MTDVLTNPMSPSAERRLYDKDRPAWIEYTAPRLALRLMEASDIGLMWELLCRESQRAVWAHLGEADRATIRTARAESVPES